MKTAGEMIDKKGREVWSVRPDTTVYDALSLLAEKNIGAVVVIDNDYLAGIVSERDYARKVILLGKASRDTLVSEIMTSEVAHVAPTESIEGCMAVMAEKHIRHLPVVEDGIVVGVISIGDVVEQIIADREKTIGKLERYIASASSSRSCARAGSPLSFASEARLVMLSATNGCRSPKSCRFKASASRVMASDRS